MDSVFDKKNDDEKDCTKEPLIKVEMKSNTDVHRVYLRTLKTHTIIQYTISTTEIMLSPIGNPKLPPILDKKSEVVILLDVTYFEISLSAK